MQVLVPHMSCVAYEEEFDKPEVQTHPEIYVITPSGILKHMKLSHNRHIRVKVDEIPGYKKEVTLGEELNFLPAGRIPYSFLEEIVEFFKQVMNIKKAEQEAMAHILWNPESGYKIGIPNQVVSKGSVNYQFDHIQKGDVIVLDIHSHNTMGSFFSTTDDRDDRRGIWYSGVVGTLDKEPSFSWRFNLNDVKYEARIEDIFDIPKKEIKIPDEWLEKVDTKAPYVGKRYPVGPWDQSWHTTGKNGQRNNANSNAEDSGSYWPSSKDASNYNYPGVFEDMMSGYEDYDIDSLPSGIHVVRNARGDTFTKETETPKAPRVITLGDEDVIKRSIETEGENAYNIIQYGAEAAEAMDQISAYLVDLEDCDDLLLELMRDIYNMLGTDAQCKLAQTGF